VVLFFLKHNLEHVDIRVQSDGVNIISVLQTTQFFGIRITFAAQQHALEQ
jgi:hypothetical protein